MTSLWDAPLPPLPYRPRPPLSPTAPRPPQVLLGVGAVLLVSAGGAVASAYGGGPARLLLLALAAAAAWFSLRAARSRAAQLRGDARRVPRPGWRCPAPTSAARCSARRPARPPCWPPASWCCTWSRRSTVTWPLAAWAPRSWRCSAGWTRSRTRCAPRSSWASPSSGSASRSFGRRIVARVALVTTAPWWLAGVVGGSSTAWTGAGGRAVGGGRARGRRGGGPAAGPAAGRARAAHGAAGRDPGAGRASWPARR